MGSQGYIYIYILPVLGAICIKYVSMRARRWRPAGLQGHQFPVGERRLSNATQMQRDDTMQYTACHTP